MEIQKLFKLRKRVKAKIFNRLIQQQRSCNMRYIFEAITVARTKLDSHHSKNTTSIKSLSRKSNNKIIDIDNQFYQRSYLLLITEASFSIFSIKMPLIKFMNIFC